MKKILFIDGTKGFSPHRLNEKPSGGIITSLIAIPEYLSKDYEVVVATNYEKEEKINGVKYVNKITGDLNPDLVVFNRNLVNISLINVFRCPKIWWLHDIVQLSYLEDNGFQYVDKIVALSKYCRDSYSDFYDIPKFKFEIISNGVNKNVFYFNGGERNKNLFICASAPIKGLQAIELCYINLKRHNPDIELRVYCSQKLHDLEDNNQVKLLFDKFRTIGIRVLDPIKQNELAAVMRQSRGLLMPNTYPEICSNLILQAQSCGLPVITSCIGSAPEFIEHEKTGLLTKTYPHDKDWFYKDFTLNAVKLMKNDDLFKFISRNSPINIVSQEIIGLLWKKLIEDII